MAGHRIVFGHWSTLGPAQARSNAWGIDQGCLWGHRLTALRLELGWLEKALVLSPEFWLARLDLFELAKSRQVLTPFFEEQLDFFIGRARHLRRFICSQCGLKRESIFFICPRCRSWHSIVFRKEFN